MFKPKSKKRKLRPWKKLVRVGLTPTKQNKLSEWKNNFFSLAILAFTIIFTAKLTVI